jgi:hypothetical protein
MNWFRFALQCVGFAAIAILSGHVLLNLERESRRLLEVRRMWRPLRRSDADELRVIRHRALIGYSAFLATSVVALAATVLKALAWI